MRRPTDRSWPAIRGRAENGDASALRIALRRIGTLDEEERHRLLRSGLAAAERYRDRALLIAVLRRAEAPLRTDALAVALDLASETHPSFSELTAVLRDEERALLVGALLEASRLDPSSERRLRRLERLTRVLAPELRDRYWPEARALAERGGDDAQLALLGFAGRLPEERRARMSVTLKRSVRRVREPFKRVMAFLALTELAPLDEDDLAEAERAVARIPDPTLRAMSAARLDEIEREGRAPPRPGPGEE